MTLSIIVNSVTVVEGQYIETDDSHWSRIEYAKRTVSGIQDLFGIDVWQILKRGSVNILRLRPQSGDDFCDIKNLERGIEVVSSDLIVQRTEVTRFADIHGLPHPDDGRCRHPSTVVVGRPGPGSQPRHDWDGFWIKVCQRIYDDGVPETQSALVRELLDWFVDNGSSVPDPSTVKKKVSKLWRAFGDNDKTVK